MPAFIADSVDSVADCVDSAVACPHSHPPRHWP